MSLLYRRVGSFLLVGEAGLRDSLAFEQDSVAVSFFLFVVFRARVFPLA